MDRITESLLAEFSQEHNLTLLPEEARFEHFASYVTVRRQYGETFDTTEIVTGSGGDTGIDAIAIIVNGHLVTDVEAFEETVDKISNLDVTFVFVQAERSPSFSTQKIGQFVFGVLDFFKDQPALPRSDAVKAAAELMVAIYKRSSKFIRSNPACHLYYVTTGRWQSDANLEARREAAIADLQATQVFGDVEFTPVGADGVQRFYSQTKNAVTREFLFPKRDRGP